MDPPEPQDPLSRLALHTATTRPWSGSECVRHFAAAGVRGITFWRFNFERERPADLGRQARETGLEVVSLARGGFFPAASDSGRRAAIDDNHRAIDEAQALGAPSLVLVCGAVPRMPLAEARAQIADGIAACLGHAAQAGVVLAIEPLHPMYAAERSAVNTVAQANALCAALGHHRNLGVALDVYHTWWDPELATGIAAAAEAGQLTAFHICDWMSPTTDFLNDRGIMGEGCIDVAGISSAVDATGFTGFREVEVFSGRHWARDQHDVLADAVARYRRLYSRQGANP